MTQTMRFGWALMTGFCLGIASAVMLASLLA